MKLRKIILSIILISILACKSETKQSVEHLKEIENEIRQLVTTNAKKMYLEKILEEDQAVRDGKKSADLMLKYGKDSDEYMEYEKPNGNKMKLI